MKPLSIDDKTFESKYFPVHTQLSKFTNIDDLIKSLKKQYTYCTVPNYLYPGEREYRNHKVNAKIQREKINEKNIEKLLNISVVGFKRDPFLIITKNKIRKINIPYVSLGERLNRHYPSHAFFAEYNLCIDPLAWNNKKEEFDKQIEEIKETFQIIFEIKNKMKNKLLQADALIYLTEKVNHPERYHTLFTYEIHLLEK